MNINLVSSDDTSHGSSSSFHSMAICSAPPLYSPRRIPLERRETQSAPAAIDLTIDLGQRLAIRINDLFRKIHKNS